MTGQDYKKKSDRQYAGLALKSIAEIEKIYPSGISETAGIGAEARAWLLQKIQMLSQALNGPSSLRKLRAARIVRKLRNDKIAHLLDDLSDEEFAGVCEAFFPLIPEIKKDMQDKIDRFWQPDKKKRKFENFGPSDFGTISERKQLVDAMEDAVNHTGSKDEKIDFPQNRFSKIAQDTLSEILERDGFGEYARSHSGVAENIQTDMLEWLQKTAGGLKMQNPFAEEEAFIDQLKKRTADEIARDISEKNSKIEYHYKRLPSVSPSKRGDIAPSSLDFNFYRGEFSAQKIPLEIRRSAAAMAALIKAFSAQDIPAAQAAENKDCAGDGPAAKSTVKKNKRQPAAVRPVPETAAKDAVREEEIKWKSEDNLEALRRNFIADMEKNLSGRKNKWELEMIDSARKQFLEELYKKIEQFQKSEKLLSPFISDLGRLWDLSSRPFETSGFEILAGFAEILENDASIQELAALLGRQNRARIVFEKELRDKTTVSTEFHPKPAYRGQIAGIAYSNDIPSVLPSELALFKKPQTKRLFMLKFAQKQLLSFQYETKEAVVRRETEQEEVLVKKEKKETKGPVIMCVDTSGSMQGTPENIAKTVAFALVKIALEEERNCYLVSFSTGIETLDMSVFKTGSALEKLVQFLQMSFYGGTDAIPALTHSVKLLQQKEWKDADILMISDFIMNALPEDLQESIEAEKAKGTKFHSLVIGSSGNAGVIKCFNHNWVYDTDDPHAARHLAEQLHELRHGENKK